MPEIITSEDILSALPPAFQSKAAVPKILVADDNPVNRQIVQLMFGKINQEITLVSSGKEAVDVACSQHFDLILMDINMPGMDGVEATAAIRGKLGNNAPAIVALTASIFDHEKERLEKVGMCGFVGKPIQLDELKALVEKYRPLPMSKN